MKTIKELHLLVGLPGSGKTYFATEAQKKDYNREIQVIDFDSVYHTSMDTVVLQIKQGRIDTRKKHPPMLLGKIVYLDGLFCTHESWSWILRYYLGIQSIKIQKVFVDYWLPNKEACKWNDRGRRFKNSVQSIEQIQIERPEENSLRLEFEDYGVPIIVRKHIVERKPAYQVFAGEAGIELMEGRYFTSSYWCLGGEQWGYDGEKSPVDPEEPCNFDEFDSLMETVCPAITFIQYKRIYKACVQMKDRENPDYYSNTREGYWSCDVKHLYELLVDAGLIEELC